MSRPEFRFLRINELIIHDIPRRLSKRIMREEPERNEDGPVFSDIASPITSEIKDFFVGKIIESITSTSAVDIIFDQEQAEDCPLYQEVPNYFTCNINERIPITRRITQHLYDIQNGQNPSGLLIFANCSTNTHETLLAVLKLEKEDGVRMHEKNEDGNKTFDVEYIRDLILSKKTKLFKIVLFYGEDVNALEQNCEIKGIVCDRQTGYYASKEVAEFFISKFLGCQLTQSAAVATKNFFEITQKFINEKIESAADKGKLTTHLVSFMTGENESILPNDFINRYLPIDKRDEYREYSGDQGLNLQRFQKNNSMIEKKLRTIQYNFESGISIYGKLEALDEKIEMEDLEDGQVCMKITDNLKDVRTK